MVFNIVLKLETKTFSQMDGTQVVIINNATNWCRKLTVSPLQNRV